MRSFRLRPFVIIFVARTGSTLLQTLLDSHPRVIATGEPFDPGSCPEAEAQIAWAEEFWRPGWGIGPRPAVGFKTKWSDIADADRFAQLIRQRNARIITLFRHNAIKNAVSLITGQERFSATGEWNRRIGESRLPRVHVDPEVLEDILRFVQRHRRDIQTFVNDLGVPTLSVAYEDLLLRRQTVLRDVCQFLGVRYRALTSPLEKNTSDDLRRAIANFSELRARYVGTRYEEMFDEVISPEN